MWPWILGSAGLGAALGGVGAYQRSGGDLGATLQGALGGGLSGAATAGIGGIAGNAVQRMAGTALAEGGALSNLLGRGNAALAQAGSAMKIPGPIAPLTAAGAGKAAGLGTNLLTQAALAAPLGALGGGAANLVGQAIGGAGSTAAAMGVGRPGGPSSPPQTNALPGGLGQFGGVAPLGGSPLDSANPTGALAGQRTAEELEADTNIRNLQRYLASIKPYADAAKKEELQRQMAAAGIRSNIATQSAMLRQAQLGAQQMGQTSLQGAVNALTSQYQYS